MNWREQFPNLRPTDLRYDKTGLFVGDLYIAQSNPRMSFISALIEFENEETNHFNTMPNGTRIQVDTKIGENVKYGSNCVIGGYGFGYEKDEGGNLIRMPHLSHVEIHDNVTIHNSVNIDRGVLSPTIIGKGTVIDSLTHLAHGAVIGEGCAIVAGAVIGGSCIIGANTFIGMNACIKQKIIIGKDCTIGAGAVVTKNVPDGEIWIGNPAKRLIK